MEEGEFVLAGLRTVGAEACTVAAFIAKAVNMEDLKRTVLHFNGDICSVGADIHTVQADAAAAEAAGTVIFQGGH